MRLFRRRVKLPTEAEWEAFESLMRDIPGIVDWIAWRIDAVTVELRDRQDPRIVPWVVLRPGPWR